MSTFSLTKETSGGTTIIENGTERFFSANTAADLVVKGNTLTITIGRYTYKLSTTDTITINPGSGAAVFSGTIAQLKAAAIPVFPKANTSAGGSGGVAGVSSINSETGAVTGYTKQGNAFNGVNQLVQTDGTGKLPALDGSQLTGVALKSLFPANVKDFGAAGDGTNSSTAFTNAIATGRPVYVPPGTYVVSQVALLAGTVILGDNAIIRPVNSASNSCFTAASISDWVIRGITFQGYNTIAASLTDNTVIANNDTNGVTFTDGCLRWKISSCTFKGFKGYGVKWATNAATFFDPTSGDSGGKIDLCHFSLNYCGAFFGEKCEYNIVSNSVFLQNVKGVWNYGGNNKYVANGITSNYYGLHLDAGFNDSHGNIVGNDFNHCNIGLLVGAIGSGEIISGNSFFSCSISATGASGLNFTGNNFNINTGTISLINCYGLSFTNNYTSSLTQPTVVTTGSTIFAFGNRDKNDADWNIVTFPYITSKAQQTYTGTVAWTGTTAPSGTTTHSYRWTKVGGMVTLRINLLFSVAGAALTIVKMSLPADCPIPAQPNGFTTDSDILNWGTGGFSTSKPVVIANNNKVWLSYDTGSATNYTIGIICASTAAFAAYATITYWTNQ